jgi:Zn-dependent protease with chaperone function
MPPDPVELARTALPGWVGWAGVLVYVALAFLMSVLCAWLSAAVALWPLRKGQPASWPERARLTFPAHRVSGLNVFLLPVIFAAFSTVYAGPLSRVHPALAAVLSSAASLLGASIVRRWVERRLGRTPDTLLYRIRGAAALLLVLIPHVFVTLMFALLMPDTLSATAGILLVPCALLLAGCSWGGGLLLARVLGLARPASARTTAVVQAAAERTGIRPKATFEMVSSMVNALALPLPQWLVFTDAALRKLSDEELAAICAHELGHLSEPAAVRIARATGMLFCLVVAAVRPITGSFGLPVFFGIIALCFVGVLGLRRMGRRMEERADAIGHAHEAGTGAYARVLERMYEYNRIPVVLGSRSGVHPELYDRLVAAGVPPAYPRPAPPSRLLGIVSLFLSLILSLVAVVGMRLVPYFAYRTAPYSSRASERAILWQTAFGGDAEELAYLAWLRSERGDREGAIRLLHGATALNRRAVSYPTTLAVELARAGRCREARSAVREAQARLHRYGGAETERDAVTAAALAAEACVEGKPLPE